MTGRCGSCVFWWDSDMKARCRLEAGHEGAHTDGLRWWDAFGLQVDGTPRPAAGRGRVA